MPAEGGERRLTRVPMEIRATVGGHFVLSSRPSSSLALLIGFVVLRHACTEQTVWSLQGRGPLFDLGLGAWSLPE
jgi:hypothetical protein